MRKWWILSVMMVAVLFSGCAKPEKVTEVGNQRMDVSSPPGGAGDYPVYYTQVFAVYAPGATSDITSTNKQSAEQDMDGNLGYNGQASSGSGTQQGSWEWLQQLMQRAGVIPKDEQVESNENGNTGGDEAGTDNIGGGDGSDGLTGKVIKSDHFHHWNPKSWDGKGSSIVLCPNDHMDQCWLNDQKLEEHGNTDTSNRQIWTDRDTPRLGGTVTCKRGEKRFVYEVDGSGGLFYGKC